MAHSSCFDSTSRVFNSPCSLLSIPADISCILHLLFSNGRFDQELPAIVDASTSQSLSYLQLRHCIHSAACALSFLGIRQHDVVLIVSPNSIHFPIIFFATVSLGAVASPVNPLNMPFEILQQAAQSHAKLIVTVPELADKLSSSFLPVLLVDDASSRPPPTHPHCARLLSELIEQSAAHTLPSIHIQQADPAALLYTSGTTGVGKRAVISHRNFIAAVLQIKLLDADMPHTSKAHGCTVLCCVPMFHAFGLSVILNAQLYMGHTIIILPKYRTIEMMAAIETYRVTHVPLVPTIMVAFSRNEAFRNYDLSSVVELLCGAGGITEQTTEEVCRRLPNAVVRLDYGMTEASGRIAVSACEPSRKCLGFVGPLVSGMEAVVVDVTLGNRLPPNKQGELWVRGPNIIQGYLDNEEATALTIDKDGWMHTGDLVFFDHNGNLHIVGRLKELIKYKSFQVAPVELETLLMTHREIADAAVVPFPDEFAGEIPLAFVVLTPGSTLKEPDVIQFVDDKVAPYKKVRKVRFVTTIPKTASGKILRHKLAQIES